MKGGPLGFVGDDFTGSTDALETFARAGLRGELFTAPPTDPRYVEGLDVIGIATTARATATPMLDAELRPAFECLRGLGCRVVHFKVCSTFDSAPHIGSIGRAIEIGREVFSQEIVSVLGGTPSLGRYCAFSNLFAKDGDGAVARIDRHATMSCHPSTPMRESDLRRHLACQTKLPVSAIDWLRLRAGATPDARCATSVVLFDALEPLDVQLFGSWLRERAASFVVGPSSVCEALAGPIRDGLIDAIAPQTIGPSLFLAGSCSPVTVGQIGHAAANGARRVGLDANAAIAELQAGRSVIVDTGATGERTGDPSFATRLATIAREVVQRIRVERVLIAGGDSSGQIARALGITSMRVIRALVRGAPLVRVSSGLPNVDGTEMVFKGGQIGGLGFFAQVRRGVV